MSDAPDYSIIIPAYNEAAQLPHTLPAIREAMAQVPGTGELIVVDNNSKDATAQVAEQLGAKVVFEPINMISKARNAGAAAASSPVLIFVDADTRPSAELLTATLEHMAREDRTGGGAEVQLDPPPNWLTRKLAGLWNWTSRQMSYPAGSYFFCRRDAFESVGGFNEAIYASEEIWLARALKRWGRRQTPKRKLHVINIPVVTSARKLDNGPKLYGMLLLMLIFPFAVRFKSLCGYWYKREEIETSLEPQADIAPGGSPERG
ncbi:MAG: glycosyltransferase [Phycisphaeraceae bacterium]